MNPVLSLGEIVLRAPIPSDADALRKIDADCLVSGHASFRSDPYDWERFRTSYMTGRSFALVASGKNGVVAWAGVSKVSARPVYQGVGEVSVYICTEARGAGLGRQLLSAVIAASEQTGYWTLTAQIFPENRASLALHRSCGFLDIGLRRRLGRMGYGPLAGQWRDVVFLERRSESLGTD